MNVRKRLGISLAVALLGGCTLAGCSEEEDKKKEPETYTLSAKATGPGSVSISPYRADGRYEKGTVVTVTARPNSGMEFVSWNGAGSGNPLKLTVSRSTTITASFDFSVGERMARDAIEALLTAARDDVDMATLEQRVSDVANTFGDARDDLYAPVTAEDVEFGDALLAGGEDPGALASIDSLVLQEVGDWEFLPGRTASFKLLYSEDPQLPNWSATKYRSVYGGWLSRVKQKVRSVYAARQLPARDLTPSETRGSIPSASYRLASDYRLSANRRQLFDQERAVYAEAARLTSDPALRARLEDERFAVSELRTIDDELVVAITQDLPAPSASASAPSASTVTPASTAVGATSVLNGVLGQ